jgi:DNA-binding NarL/FixJ family response regulator
MVTPSEAVLIVAPPTLYRLGLLVTLRESWPALAISAIPALEQLVELLVKHRFSLIIVDCSEPSLELPTQLLQLRSCYPYQQFLVLTGRGLPAGACQLLVQTGYPQLPRHTTPTAVATTVDGLLRQVNGTSLPSSVPYKRRTAPPTPFSRRELEVLHLVVEDYCNQDIADRLFVSVRTVESHRRALLQKTGAKTLVGLVVQAMREGWVGMALGSVIDW